MEERHAEHRVHALEGAPFLVQLRVRRRGGGGGGQQRVVGALVARRRGVGEPRWRGGEEEPDDVERPRRPAEQPVEACRVVRLAACPQIERIDDRDEVVEEVGQAGEEVEEGQTRRRHAQVERRAVQRRLDRRDVVEAHAAQVVEARLDVQPAVHAVNAEEEKLRDGAAHDGREALEGGGATPGRPGHGGRRRPRRRRRRRRPGAVVVLRAPILQQRRRRRRSLNDERQLRVVGGTHGGGRPLGGAGGGGRPTTTARAAARMTAEVTSSRAYCAATPAPTCEQTMLSVMSWRKQD